MKGIFDGDLGKAQARLRNLADEGARILTATQLNMLSAMIANIISGDPQSADQIEAECKTERAEMQKAWEAMGGGEL